MSKLKFSPENVIGFVGIVLAIMQVIQINPIIFPEIQYRIFTPINDGDIQIQNIYIGNTGGAQASNVHLVVDFREPVILRFIEDDHQFTISPKREIQADKKRIDIFFEQISVGESGIVAVVSMNTEDKPIVRISYDGWRKIEAKDIRLFDQILLLIGVFSLTLMFSRTFLSLYKSFKTNGRA